MGWGGGVSGGGCTHAGKRPLFWGRFKILPTLLPPLRLRPGCHRAAAPRSFAPGQRRQPRCGDGEGPQLPFHLPALTPRLPNVLGSAKALSESLRRVFFCRVVLNAVFLGPLGVFLFDFHVSNERFCGAF